MEHDRPPETESCADARHLAGPAVAQLIVQHGLHIRRENATRRQLGPVARFGEVRFPSQLVGGAFNRGFEGQVLEGVQGIVVNEDADRALRRQQGRQPIDHARQRMVGRFGFVRTDAVRHRPIVSVIAILLYYNCMGLHRRREGRRRRAPLMAGVLQLFKAQFFRALAHPVRIRILEILVCGGRTVQELQQALQLEQPLVSQQLAVLRNQNVVSAQKEGLSVRYTVRDPLVGDLLDVARRIFNNHFASAQGLLRELRRELRRA